MGVLSVPIHIYPDCTYVLTVEQEFLERKGQRTRKGRTGLTHSGAGQVDDGTWPPPTARRAAARESAGRLRARRAEMVGVALGSQS